MRRLSSFATIVVALAAASSAQSPLVLGQPLTSPNQGNVGGGIYFNLTVATTITITSITYVSSNVSTAGMSACTLYVGPSTWVGNVAANPGPWSLFATTQPVPIVGGIDETVVGVFVPAGINPGPLTLAPGNYGIAMQAIGHSWGYQNGAQTFMNTELTVTTGGASNTFLALPSFMPRTITGQIDYMLGGTPFGPAVQSYGDGCYARYQSFYEVFPNPATGFDLNSSSMRLQYDPVDNTYDVSLGTVSPIAPVAGPLAFGGNDDSVTVQLQNAQPLRWAGLAGTATSPIDPITGNFVCDVSADGFVSFVPGSNAALAPNNPDVTAFLAGGARFGTWHDMDVLAGGSIIYDYNAVLQAHVITWAAVRSRANAGTNTFQLLFFANGDIEARWSVMNLTVGGGWPTLVGFTPGGGALDPGSRDLSPAPLFSTSTVDTAPLTLAANAPPALGTTVLLTTSNESSQPGVGATFFSFTQLLPPITLAILGAPGCWIHVGTVQVGAVIDNIPVNGMTVAVPIPNNPALIGTVFYGQSVWIDATQNALGLSSNGLRLIIG